MFIWCRQLNKIRITKSIKIAKIIFPTEYNLPLKILNFDLFCNDNTCLRIFAWSATLPANLY